MREPKLEMNLRYTEYKFNKICTKFKKLKAFPETIKKFIHFNIKKEIFLNQHILSH